MEKFSSPKSRGDLHLLYFHPCLNHMNSTLCLIVYCVNFKILNLRCVFRKNEEISLSLISQKLFVEYNSKRFSYILPSIYIFIYFRVKDFVAKYLIYSSCKFYPLCICNVHCNNFKCICIMGTKSQNLVYSLVILSKVSLI